MLYIECACLLLCWHTAHKYACRRWRLSWLFSSSL
uniref:Uncharacterized protein n=1 Tax=Arundo donax TaxID=35708 RepID=A0A0A9HB08_ARUDO